MSMDTQGAIQNRRLGSFPNARLFDHYFLLLEAAAAAAPPVLLSLAGALLLLAAQAAGASQSGRLVQSEADLDFLLVVVVALGMVAFCLGIGIGRKCD